MTARVVTRVVHVVPKSDLIEHELNSECVCGPEVYIRLRNTTAIVMHASLDGRELAESEYWSREVA